MTNEESNTQPQSTPTRVERGGGGGDEGFAGMPGGPATMGGEKVGAGQKLPGGMGTLMSNLREGLESQRSGARAYTQFVLSKKLVSDEFEASGFQEEHLTFKICELTPEEEERAMANAGQGMKLMAQMTEMVKASIYRIGDTRPNYDQKTAWLRAIGPRCRKQVDRAFNHVNGIEEREGEDILATAQSGRG